MADHNGHVTRIDAVEVVVDPQYIDAFGAIRGVPIVVAKPGIQEYQDPKTGRTFRELVPRSVLKDAQLVASLEGAPIGVEHPVDLHITPDNDAEVVGATYEGAWSEAKDAQVARANVVRRNGLRAVEQGKIYFSPSYKARVDETPGTDPEFGPYDTVQTWRSPYNSVVLTGSPRGGETIKMQTRADAMSTKIKTVDRADNENTPANPPAAPPRADNEMAEIKQMLAALPGQVAQAVAEAMKPKADMDDDPAKKKPGEMDKADTRTVAQLADELVDIREKADSYGVELPKDKSNTELKRLVVEKAGMTLPEGADAATVDALYANLSVEDRGDGHGRWGRLSNPSKNRADGGGKKKGLGISMSEVRKAASAN